MSLYSDQTKVSPFIYVVKVVNNQKLDKIQCFNLGGDDLSSYMKHITNLLSQKTDFIVFGLEDGNITVLHSTTDNIDNIVANINVDKLPHCNVISYGKGAFGEVKQDTSNSRLVVKTPVSYWSPFKSQLARTSIIKEQIKLSFLNNIDKSVREKYTLLLPSYSRDANQPIIKFKACNGVNLVSYLESLNGENEKDERLKLFKQSIDGLLLVSHELYRFGFSHCDIKPNNLMVCRDGVKVIDFGNIAKGENDCIGTPKYYPENVNDFLLFAEVYSAKKQKNVVSPTCLQILKKINSSLSKEATFNYYTRDLYAIGITLAIIYPYDDDLTINTMISYLIDQSHNEFKGSESPFGIAKLKWNDLQSSSQLTGGKKKEYFTYKHKKYIVKKGKLNGKYIVVDNTKIYISSKKILT